MATVLGEKTLDMEVLAKIQREIRRCEKDALYYTENYVKIEDRDVPEIAIPFKLWRKSVREWPSQKQAFEIMLQERFSISLKARQLGITWMALSISSWLMLFKQGQSVIALSRIEDPEAKELVRRMKFIFRNLPKWMAREKKKDLGGWDGPVWEGGVLNVTVNHKKVNYREGEAPQIEELPPSTFKSLSSSPDSGRSLTGNLLILDEWALQEYAREIWDAAYPTINRPTGGQVFGISTGRRNTLFEEVWKDAESGVGIFTPVFLPWDAHPLRTKKWYEDTKKAMPRTYRREYPSEPSDAFAIGEGMFFDVWDPTVHVPFGRDWYPPEGSGRIVCAYDGGYNNACFKWYWISPDGLIICYREYYPHKVNDVDQKEKIIEMSRDPNGGPELLAYSVADTSCWGRHTDTGVSTAEIFGGQKYHGRSIPLRKADKDRIVGWRRLHYYLKPFKDHEGVWIARLRFTKAAYNTIRTYPMMETNKNDPEDLAPHQEDHPQDCDRYLVMTRPHPGRTKKEKKKNRESFMKRIKPISKYTGY